MHASEPHKGACDPPVLHHAWQFFRATISHFLDENENSFFFFSTSFPSFSKFDFAEGAVDATDLLVDGRTSSPICIAAICVLGAMAAGAGCR